MTLERKNYSALALPVGPYVHAVKWGNTLYLSGLTAFGSDAQGGTIERQADAVFQQINTIAESEGSSLTHLIQVTIYVTDLRNMEGLRNRLFSIYGEHLPASTLVKVSELFSSEIHIEITATLALP